MGGDPGFAGFEVSVPHTVSGVGADVFSDSDTWRYLGPVYLLGLVLSLGDLGDLRPGVFKGQSLTGFRHRYNSINGAAVGWAEGQAEATKHKQ